MVRSIRPAATAAVAMLAVASCAVQAPAPAPELGRTESAIRGGATDSADPAVATLSVLGLYAYCTAALIAPHTVLTAGHCNLIGMEVDFGTEADSPTQSIDVAEVAVHPQYTDEGKPYDLALMKLASDPAGIAPVALNDGALGDGDLGRMMRHVGFGATDDSTGAGSGTKRTASYPLHRIDGILIYSGAPGEQSCVGDSGGPAFMTGSDGSEAIVGVVSDGPDCQLSQDGWDDRVDLVKDWIVQTVGGWDAPPTFRAASADPGGVGAAGDAPGGGAPASSVAGCSAGGGHGGTGLGVCLLGALSWLRARRRRRR